MQRHGQQKMAGSILDLVITSAAFDKERRKSTKSKVGASIIGHADSWRVSRVTNYIFFFLLFVPYCDPMGYQLNVKCT